MIRQLFLAVSGFRRMRRYLGRFCFEHVSGFLAGLFLDDGLGRWFGAEYISASGHRGVFVFGNFGYGLGAQAATGKNSSNKDGQEAGVSAGHGRISRFKMSGRWNAR